MGVLIFPYDAVRYSTVWNGVVRNCTVRCSAMQCSAAGMVQHTVDGALHIAQYVLCIIECSTSLYSTACTVQHVQYIAVQYVMVQNSAMQDIAVLCSTMQCRVVSYTRYHT